MATPGLQQHQQPPGPGRHRWPPPPGGAAPAPVRGMTDSPPPAVGCVLSGLTGTLSPSRSCSVCTSPSSPPATGTGPAAPTAICQPPCRNGGSCVQPGRCRCPAGWRGDTCQSGVDSAMKEEVQRLQSRVDLLEEKLQLVLAPLHSLASQALEHGLPDPGSLLVHSFQQLGRIDSLSEQISFLEEQLGSCSCKKDS
ncbi:epidermal growth factor-like protein 7 isoform X6 [Homo sapiens]|uniref:epidermal growth factor-like protein 7 isoform X6 n=1 Tax=Homo sapiens TaxID=9606 RepID=UPI001FB09A7E|nr:epidermal growth factor-like protein 7 isoform X6 [Homo sapiens]XP_054219049.1 epidermal growth factor-like protein 7 isoform X6 [Homo sapiens]